jgi:hypothetical protein
MPPLSTGEFKPTPKSPEEQQLFDGLEELNKFMAIRVVSILKSSGFESIKHGGYLDDPWWSHELHA